MWLHLQKSGVSESHDLESGIESVISLSSESSAIVLEVTRLSREASRRRDNMAT